MGKSSFVLVLAFLAVLSSWQQCNVACEEESPVVAGKEGDNFSWRSFNAADGSRNIKFYYRARNDDKVLLLRKTETYPFPENADVKNLLSEFKTLVKWKEPLRKPTQGHDGNLFWYTQWEGDLGHVYFQCRVVFRNHIMVIYRENFKFDDEKIESIESQMQKLVKKMKDRCAKLSAEYPAATDGPSMRYEMVDNDSKVKVIYENLENGKVLKEHDKTYTLKDPYSIASINRLMGRMLFYCDRLKRC